ncbi:hypothetical protein FPV67DRAFT_1449059 [Lyophyllum atratum]|nr:hypothetical protein FPV67DRAFT_1449059 [Lyophyllum atratum]
MSPVCSVCLNVCWVSDFGVPPRDKAGKEIRGLSCGPEHRHILCSLCCLTLDSMSPVVFRCDGPGDARLCVIEESHGRFKGKYHLALAMAIVVRDPDNCNGIIASRIEDNSLDVQNMEIIRLTNEIKQLENLLADRKKEHKVQIQALKHVHEKGMHERRELKDDFMDSLKVKPVFYNPRPFGGAASG